ncbi:STM4015 family protein [Streptomyces sp. NPDC047725]|uniref:STM4015 family protein n=1 Tax=Streptomyces sp. NPDC047725 TaxID=3365487 RepID=UPI0037170493
MAHSYPTHLTSFHGLPVHEFPALDEEKAAGRPAPAPGSVAWRISCAWEEDPFDVLWRRFHDEVRTEEVTALVIGPWWPDWDEDGIGPVLDLITGDAHRLPRLRAVFLADVESEESEISWIKQGEVTRVLRAWPGLEELGVRGAEDLVVEPLRHEALRTLRIESGGLPRDPVRALAAGEFPALRHMELWLGTSWYGGDCRPEEIHALLDGLDHSPDLRHLGLRNSDIQDDICAAVASAPLVARLEELDLSMGVLGDEGGEALLGGQPLTHLDALDLSHHFMSEPMTERLRETFAPHGVRLSLDPAPYGGRMRERYVAVGE